MMRFKSRCVLLFPVVAVWLAVAMLSPGARCAEDEEEEILISLPTKSKEPKNREPKNREPKASSTSATQKNSSVSQETAKKKLLQGVFYDLKQTRNRQDVPAFKNLSASTNRSELAVQTGKILREFITGPWQRHYDKEGRVSFPALNQYYCAPNRFWNTCFFAEETASSNVPQICGLEEDISSVASVFIYSGYVMAPFSGRFRFVGYGDDYMVVRFRKEIVLDYGNYSATIGSEFNNTLRAKLSGSGDAKTKNPIERKRPSMTENTYYSENRLVTCTPSFMSRTLAKGPILEVKKGEVIPIEILISDLGGTFSFALFLERVTVNGDPLYGKTPIYQLFRTSNDLPAAFSGKTFPDFDKGLIWTVVDSTGKPIPSRTKKADESTSTSAKPAASRATSTSAKSAAASSTAGADSSIRPDRA